MPKEDRDKYDFSKSQIKDQGHMLLGDLGTLATVNPSIFGVSKWNKNWNVGNSYSYVATATTIRFYFRLPRSPDAVFDDCKLEV